MLTLELLPSHLWSALHAQLQFGRRIWSAWIFFFETGGACECMDAVALYKTNTAAPRKRDGIYAVD